MLCNSQALAMASQAFFFFLLLLLLPCTSYGYNANLLSFCSHIPLLLPPQNLQAPPSSSRPSFSLAFFHGGFPLFNLSSSSLDLGFHSTHQSAQFSVTSIAPSLIDGVFRLQASLTLKHSSHPSFLLPTASSAAAGVIPFVQSTSLEVIADGVWDSNSGSLCLVGCSAGTHSDCHIGITLTYPKRKTISSLFVRGKVESLRPTMDRHYFEPIWITALSAMPYEYTKDDEHKRACAVADHDAPANIQVVKDLDTPICPLFRRNVKNLQAVWNRECSGPNCSPFHALGLFSSKSPTFLTLQRSNCHPDGRKLAALFSFHEWRLGPASMGWLVAEGSWNSRAGQLCMTACHLVNDSSAHQQQQDCEIVITMQFPTTLNLLFRHPAVGHIHSRKPTSDPLYFQKFALRPQIRRQAPEVFQKLEYSYTELDQAESECKKHEDKVATNLLPRAKFPDGSTFADFVFSAKLRSSQGSTRWGVVSPLTLNDRFGSVNQFYQLFPHAPMSYIPVPQRLFKTGARISVSFDMDFGMEFELLAEGSGNSSLNAIDTFSRLSAEGFYYPASGRLCVIACRTIAFREEQMASLEGDGHDCRMLVTVQYPPNNPEYFGQQPLKGEISSLREPGHPWFFEPMNLTSAQPVYHVQALETVWRKNLEIIMSTISYSMAAVSTGFQLLHIKRLSSILPNVSLLMLSVLTLGHMIPLILNIEAVFTNRSTQNILLWSGKWLEINEAFVSLLNMVVFLMLLRLLQQAWAGKKRPWSRERSVLFVCLPVYLLGGTLAYTMHWQRGGTHARSARRYLGSVLEHAWWAYMKGYAGLISDFFLLPQMIGNLIWSVEELVLAHPFYIGMTLVRALPHIYDTVRAFKFIPQYNYNYFYANPDGDFYSTAWNIIISCGTVILATIIFLQQRYGGGFFTPQRWRHRFQNDQNLVDT